MSAHARGRRNWQLTIIGVGLRALATGAGRSTRLEGFMGNNKRALVAAAAAALLTGATSAQAATVTVSVDGSDNPFLAGAPNGATTGGDTAPAQSPTLALTGFDTTQVITFSAVGGFSFSGGSPSPTADGNGGVGGMSSGVFGISGPTGIFFNSLVGVFLDDSVPGGAAPAQLNINTAFTTLSPGLRQIFYIGDGLTGTGSGSVQQFFAPTGATRLYLGSADGSGWFNNSGVSNVTISYTPSAVQGGVPEPATWAMLIVGFGMVGAGLRRRRLGLA
jgi:hypothetical protein